jgi:hypothetical protein
MYISGNRVFITYEGKLSTCYTCNENGHQSNECPYKRSSHPFPTHGNEGTWAHLVQHSHNRPNQETPVTASTDMQNHQISKNTDTPIIDTPIQMGNSIREQKSSLHDAQTRPRTYPTDTETHTPPVLMDIETGANQTERERERH